MPLVQKNRIRSSPSGGQKGHSHAGIQLYGWDSQNEIWHGPTELSCCSMPDKRLLQILRSVHANGINSWYGRITSCSAGEPTSRFFVIVQKLPDAAVALIYCNDSKAGPAEILAVLPANRRLHLRDEFAFEFLAFAHFLGAVNAEAELQLHDAIASALADRHDFDDLVFSISSVIWPGDLDSALSCCVEKVAVTICHWLDGWQEFGNRTRENSTSAA
jgi:hypothetical protein